MSSWKEVFTRHIKNASKEYRSIKKYNTRKVKSNVNIRNISRIGNRYVISFLHNGKRHRKSFSIDKYGDDEALKLAKRYLKNVVSL
jgi:hypothetical protein